LSRLSPLFWIWALVRRQPSENLLAQAVNWTTTLLSLATITIPAAQIQIKEAVYIHTLILLPKFKRTYILFPIWNPKEYLLVVQPSLGSAPVVSNNHLWRVNTMLQNILSVAKKKSYLCLFASTHAGSIKIKTFLFLTPIALLHVWPHSCNNASKLYC
jgi:hypothetical protein